jgi:sulfate permease, SulP family
VIYRFGTSLYFANTPKLVDEVMALTGHGGPVRWLVIDCTAIEDIDYTASVVLARLAEQLQQRHVRLVLSTVLGPVRQQLDRYGIGAALGPGCYYGTPTEALEAFHAAEEAAGSATPQGGEGA